MTRVYPDRICVLGTEEGIELVQIEVRDKQGRPETLIYRSDENYQFSWDGRAPSRYEEVFILPSDVTRDFVWLFVDLDINFCIGDEKENSTCKTEWNVPCGYYELSEKWYKAMTEMLACRKLLKDQSLSQHATIAVRLKPKRVLTLNDGIQQLERNWKQNVAHLKEIASSSGTDMVTNVMVFNDLDHYEIIRDGDDTPVTMAEAVDRLVCNWNQNIAHIKKMSKRQDMTEISNVFVTSSSVGFNLPRNSSREWHLDYNKKEQIE